MVLQLVCKSQQMKVGSKSVGHQIMWYKSLLLSAITSTADKSNLIFIVIDSGI